jgi:hypothetical protein
MRMLLVAAGVVFLAAAGLAQRRDVFVTSRDHPAIAYGATPANDAAAQLNQRLQNGTAHLTFEEDAGYLRSLLDALDVPTASQALVFSKTSFQGDLITMRNPRAVYFNDTVSVGWVRGGELLEISAQDARQGVVFYTLEQKRQDRPQLVRDDQCLACHLSWDTLGVPGLMMMSTLPRADENAYAAGFLTDHRSPFGERWSGWYVTGNAGRHLGNRPVTPDELKRSTVAAPARALRSLEGLFDLKGFPTPYSDAAALMVLAHQTHVTNLMTRVGWEARIAQEGGSDGATRVRDAAADLVDYMLFVDEPALPAPVDGDSGFAAAFASAGPRDERGRSLRELDLTRRLMRYPCSYTIYSPAFDALPTIARDAVFARLWAVLSGRETGAKYKVLAPADRQAVIDILRATKPDLPAYFLTSNTTIVAK